MYLFTPPAASPISVNAYLAPTLNFVPGRGSPLRGFASTTNPLKSSPPSSRQLLRQQNGNVPTGKTVKDSIRITTSKHTHHPPPIPEG